VSAAQDGHAAVFQEYRPLLFSLAYRMIGSAAEAEDILQDAYLRFQPAPLDAIETPKAYLSAIVIRLCLNYLASARVRRETYVGPWLPEPVGDAAHPELAGPETSAVEADTISLAFLVLLERLTPAERAVFLLREVFEYEYDEIAKILDRSEPACRKLFSRARGHIARHRPRFQASPDEHRRLLEQFLHAARTGDLNGLTALLADDVTMWADGGGKIPGAALRPVHGAANVARFLIGVAARFTPPGARLAVVNVNGKPTVLVQNADGTPFVVVSIEVDGSHIRTVWAIGNPDKLTAV
jgi:RNA polymerase sigma-70 factor (ECF subfamily)